MIGRAQLFARLTFWLLGSSILLAGGCTEGPRDLRHYLGSSSPTPMPTAPSSPGGTQSAGFSFSWSTASDTAPSGGNVTSILLYAQQPADMTHAATAVAVSAPTTSNAPPTANFTIYGTSTGTAVFQGSGGLNPAPAPPPGGIVLAIAHPGVAVLNATVQQAPYANGSIPVFAFNSISIGCDVKANAGYSLTAAGLLAPNTAQSADLWMSGPATPSGATCGAFADPSATKYTLHFPYGAALTTNGNDPFRAVVSGAIRTPDFQHVPVSAFVPAFTAIDGPTLVKAFYPCGFVATCATLDADILIFRTQSGEIVKFAALRAFGTPIETNLIGPYLATTAGSFPF